MSSRWVGRLTTFRSRETGGRFFSQKGHLLPGFWYLMTAKMSNELDTNFLHVTLARHIREFFVSLFALSIRFLTYVGHGFGRKLHHKWRPAELFSTARFDHWFFYLPSRRAETRRDNWHSVSTNQRLVTLHTPASHEKNKTISRYAYPSPYFAIRTSCDH